MPEMYKPWIYPIMSSVFAQHHPLYKPEARKPRYFSWEEPTVKGRSEWHKQAQKARKRKKRARKSKRGY